MLLNRVNLKKRRMLLNCYSREEKILRSRNRNKNKNKNRVVNLNLNLNLNLSLSRGMKERE